MIGRFAILGRRALITLFASALASAVWGQGMRVVVNASADEAYVEATKDKPYQTYHFYKGNYFPGASRDKGQEKIGFAEVAKLTAEFLEKRSFYPAADKEGGDLLIMITWGTTIIDDDFTDLMGITDLGNNEASEAPPPDQSLPEGPDDSGPSDQVNYQPSGVESQGGGSYQSRKNTTILGFDKGFNGPSTSVQRERLRHELSEPRYFIVLNAFDLPHMRETGELKELWSTRCSMRNLGTNFENALKMMNVAAAPTFGMNLEGLQVPRIDPKSRVKLGEIEVLEVKGKE